MNDKNQIEAMADILCDAKEHDCQGGNDCLCIKQATALYNAGYRKQSEWISVEDRLPDEANDYIVALRYSSGAYFSTKRSYSKERGWYGVSADHYYRETAVTHWMPFPSPPAEKEN